MQRLRRTDDDGAIAVIVAVLLVVFTGLGVIVLDVGSLYAERRQLQNAADAAALAVVVDCPSPTQCDTSTAATGLAGGYANANSNDDVTTVTEVCGQGANLLACSPASPAGPWDCRTLPSSGPLSTAAYVQVRTQTLRSDGSSLMPPIFGRVLDPSYSGTEVRACARVSWGGPGGLTSAIPLTISNCEFENLVGSPPSNFATPAPPYPPYPDASHEHVMYFHDTTEAAANSCPAGPSGSDDPISGGFGWLESTDCEATSDTSNPAGWDASPGTSPGSDCKANQLDDLIGEVVYIPIYDGTNGLSGANGKYYMKGFAAFVLTGYYLGGSYKEPSIVSSSPGGDFPCANLPTEGSQRCISGFFLADLADLPPGATIGGPDLGLTVFQMSG